MQSISYNDIKPSANLDVNMKRTQEVRENQINEEEEQRWGKGERSEEIKMDTELPEEYYHGLGDLPWNLNSLEQLLYISLPAWIQKGEKPNTHDNSRFNALPNLLLTLSTVTGDEENIGVGKTFAVHLKSKVLCGPVGSPPSLLPSLRPHIPPALQKDRQMSGKCFCGTSCL